MKSLWVGFLFFFCFSSLCPSFCSNVFKCGFTECNTFYLSTYLFSVLFLSFLFIRLLYPNRWKCVFVRNFSNKQMFNLKSFSRLYTLTHSIARAQFITSNILLMPLQKSFDTLRWNSAIFIVIRIFVYVQNGRKTHTFDDAILSPGNFINGLLFMWNPERWAVILFTPFLRSHLVSTPFSVFVPFRLCIIPTLKFCFNN